MKLKKFALRGLISLAVMVALCMFFARTVQTITTPKVQVITASSGRFEEKMTFHAQVHFPKTEEIVVEEAQALNVTVKSIHVKPGHYVQKGETIFTTQAPSYQEDMEKLQKEYETKAKELTDLDIQNRKLSKESRQNELYQDLLEAQSALNDAAYAARVLALENGVPLTGDAATWSQQLTLAGGSSTVVRLAVDKVERAQKAYNDIHAAFYELLEDKKLKVKDEVFKYINDRNDLLKAMDDLTQQMLDLHTTMTALETVTAPRDGYIVSISVEEGAVYDGTKAAFAMNADGALPVLRAPLGGVERAIADGSRADIVSDVYGTQKTVVEKTVTELNGGKSLQIALPEELLTPQSGAVRSFVNDDGVEVTITYRAKKATTLLPPSAVRGQKDDYYVYLIQQDWGGFMSSRSMKVVKTPVTVLEKSGKAVSISEDLSYQRIADREDRALTDGQTVMEYIQ